MRQLARWYDVKVMYEGKIPQRIQRHHQPERKLSAVLELVQKTGNIIYYRKQNGNSNP